jgi:hypothetical protein
MIEVEDVDTWYPIIKGKGSGYSKVLKNIFLNFGVKGFGGYTFDSCSCYYYITKDGYSMRASSTAGKFYYNTGTGEKAVQVKMPTVPTKTSELTNDSGFVTSADIPDTSGFVTTNTTQKITGSKIFSGTVGNTQTEAGIYLGLDENVGAENANMAIVSANTASYIDMGRPNVDYDFRIIKWNTNDNKHAQLVYGGNASGTITIPQANGVMALTSDIPTNTNQLTNGAGYITSSSLGTQATFSLSGTTLTITPK